MKIKNYGELYCYFDYYISKTKTKILTYVGIELIGLIGVISNIQNISVIIQIVFILSIASIPLFKKFIKFIKSAEYSFNYLKENMELMLRELENPTQDMNSYFILTKNYYIDLSTFNIVKFDEIVSKKYKFGVSYIPTIRGLNRYCILKDNKGREFTIILYSFSRFYAEDSKVYDIIENRLSKLN